MRRVLAARLADARFFWEQDLKVPLEEQAKKLDGIIFHEKLGTVADKVERVAKLARWLVEKRRRRSASRPGRARRAAGQGRPGHRHGRRIPRAARRDRRLSRRGAGRAEGGRRRHPRSLRSGGRARVPTPRRCSRARRQAGHNLCILRIDQKPTGSKDPFALRRAAISSIELIVGNGFVCIPSSGARCSRQSCRRSQRTPV